VRVAAFVGQLAVSLALGALVVGYALTLPLLEQGSELVDPNLGKALGHGIALRLGLLILVASAITAVVARRWTQSSIGTTLALSGLVLAALDRVAILPRLYETWARVDLVAGRPAERLADASQLSHWHEGVCVVLALCLLAVAGLGTRAGGRAPPATPA
jgi:hypothetical protein